jgi:uncharacterized protein
MKGYDPVERPPVGDLCAVADQSRCCQILAGPHARWDHRSRGGEKAAGFQGPTRCFDRSHTWDVDDHYDPRSKILRLSQSVYFAPSVAAAGIAAHEAGHALQDAEDYLPMEARTYIVSVVQLASKIAPWLFVAGLMLQLSSLTWAGVILFGSSSLFAFLTLLVEFNASSRAQELLVSQGIIRGEDQISGVREVLGAAAWTYVAAAVAALGSWLFYVILLLSQTRSATQRS